MIYEHNNKIYEWDDNKARINKEKHNVTFQDAVKVFDDENRIVDYDYKHSTATEDRYSVLGQADGVLYVIYTERENTRIISARRATKIERRRYHERIY